MRRVRNGWTRRRRSGLLGTGLVISWLLLTASATLASNLAWLPIRCATLGSTTPNFCHEFNNTLESFANFILPRAVTLRDMRVYCDAAMSTGTQTFTLRMGGADQSLTCTVSSQTCDDLFSVTGHAVAVSAGTAIDVKSVGTAGASTPTCHITFAVRDATDSAETSAVFAWETGGSLSPTAGNFFGPGDAAVQLNDLDNQAVAANVNWTLASAGTLNGLAVLANQSPGAAATVTFTVCNTTLGDCSDTAHGLTDLSVTLGSGNGAQQLSTTCTTNCAVSQGDQLALKVTGVTGTPANNTYHFAVTVDGVGGHVVFRTIKGLSASFRQWFVGSGVETNSGFRLPSAANLQHLYCTLNGAPANATTYAVCTGSTNTPTCSSTFKCSVSTSQTSCSDTTDTLSINAGDFVVISETAPGSGSGTQGCSLEAVPPGPTNTPTETPTDTPTGTPTDTATVTDTPTSTPTETATLTPSNTNTPTQTPTVTQTPTDTPSSTVTPTNTQTPTQTETLTPSVTETPSMTQTPSDTPTDTPTSTQTATATPTLTPTATGTSTDTPTVTPTATETATASPSSTPTQTPTATATGTATPTFTPTATPTATGTPTSTGTATQTPTRTLTATPTSTRTPTATPTDTVGPSPTPTNTPRGPVIVSGAAAGSSMLSGISTASPGCTIGAMRAFDCGPENPPVCHDGNDVEIDSFAAVKNPDGSFSISLTSPLQAGELIFVTDGCFDPALAGLPQRVTPPASAPLLTPAMLGGLVACLTLVGLLGLRRVR